MPQNSTDIQDEAILHFFSFHTNLSNSCFEDFFLNGEEKRIACKSYFLNENNKPVSALCWLQNILSAFPIYITEVKIILAKMILAPLKNKQPAKENNFA